MTGFGDATARWTPDDSAATNGTGAVECFIEIRSVNNKYFKTVMRLPEELQPLEPEIEVAVKKRLDRGTVTCRLVLTDTSEAAALEINHRALDRYVEQISGSQAVSSGKVALDVAALLTLPGVLQPPGGEDARLQRARAAIMPKVDEACGAVLEMRAREGETLEGDLSSQLDVISKALEQVAVRAPEVVRNYETRLKQRIEMLVGESGTELEQGDLVREIAVYAEKTDIAEEITRLRGHIAHFREKMATADGAPVGRTLEFLGQEMLREANTMASKSPDGQTAELVVEIKGAIDRIKEQVLNVA